jgi:3-oxoacyl-[acyl-carrier-protein] synthase-3
VTQTTATHHATEAFDASASAPALIATGSAFPAQIRTNDDPIFDWLHDNPQFGDELFSGYIQRRVLGPGESVTSIMVAAARAALAQGALKPAQIDLLLGFGSVGQYVTPNTLAQVHEELGLPASTEVLPLANDMTNWASAVVIADAMIRAGRIQRALIVCGGNWTQHVNYHTPQAISAGDGAGATVVGPPTAEGQWRLLDREWLTVSQDYGDMFMAADSLPAGSFGPVYMHLTAEGLKDYVAFGEKQATEPVKTLLHRNGVMPEQVTMICHQASLKIISVWQQALPGITILQTIASYANLVLATIPANLDLLGSQIATDYLVTLGLGVQLHAGALLFTRDGALPIS